MQIPYLLYLGEYAVPLYFIKVIVCRFEGLTPKVLDSASNALPGRLPGQCASMHPEPTTLGVNAPYRVPKILGLLRARALLALSRT